MSRDALHVLVVGGALALRAKIKELLTTSEMGTGGLWSATTVAQALALLQQQRCDAILMTWRHFGGVGLDAVTALNLAVPGIPILAVTGSRDLLMGRMAVRAGADDCLVASDLDGRQLERAIWLACERRKKLTQLTAQAWRDALTGLPNRALLHDRLMHMVARASRYGGLIGLLFIDLDDFKLVNDSLGHAGGDTLLRAVAMRLTGAVRRSDTVARLGGDEFVVALENLSRREDAEQVAAVIEARMREPFRVDGRPLAVSASIGVAVMGPEAANADALLRLADSAMYRVKRAKAARL